MKAFSLSPVFVLGHSRFFGRADSVQEEASNASLGADFKHPCLILSAALDSMQALNIGYLKRENPAPELLVSRASQPNMSSARREASQNCA